MFELTSGILICSVQPILCQFITGMSLQMARSLIDESDQNNDICSGTFETTGSRIWLDVNRVLSTE
jgi:hypothetical protein